MHVLAFLLAQFDLNAIVQLALNALRRADPLGRVRRRQWLHGQLKKNVASPFSLRHHCGHIECPFFGIQRRTVLIVVDAVHLHQSDDNGANEAMLRIAVVDAHGYLLARLIDVRG